MNDERTSTIVFRRWLKSLDPSDPFLSKLLSVAAILSDDEALHGVVPRDEVAILDQNLIRSYLSYAEPNEAIDLLGLYLGRYVSVDLFQECYDKLWQAVDDVESRSRLLWVAGRFLDEHPQVFELPKELAEKFLNSFDQQLRLRGLTAYRHTSASDTELAQSFAKLLGMETYADKWAALSGIHILISSRGEGCLSACTTQARESLQKALESIENQDSDHNAQTSAAHARQLLWGCDKCSPVG